MKDYRQFLFEAKETTLPLQILMRGNIGLTSKTEDFTDAYMKTLYDKYIRLCLIDENGKYNKDDEVASNRLHELDYKFPILNFTSTETELHKHKDATIFNQLEDYSISANKKVFQKELGDNIKCVPKAVYSVDDIEELELPIIAKPGEGKSAEGIEKFDTYEDVRKSKLEFDIWTECKDLDKEFRAFIMNGEIILIAERITNTKNDMSVGKKDVNEKIDLVYIDQDLENFPHLDKIKKIQKQLETKVKLDFYNIDLMLDKDEVLWVPEINGAPGIGPSQFRTIYSAWLKMAYNKTIPKNVDDELKEIEVSHRKEMAKEYPKEYKSSLKPI